LTSTETKTVVERVRYNKIKIVITIIVKRYSCITRDIDIQGAAEITPTF